MLPKINRIKKKKDFDAIFKGATGPRQSFKNDIFILKTVKNNLEINRLGLIVSLKVSKKATVRNKIRRRLAEAAGVEIKKIKPGTDLILIALSGIKEKDFSIIKETLRGALIKTGLLIKDKK